MGEQFFTREAIARGFALWEQEAGTRAPMTQEEWEALSPEEQGEIQADYLIDLMNRSGPPLQHGVV